MSLVFNPFTSNFDEVSDLTVTVGSSPNSNASTVSEAGTSISLTLQPANTSFPGILLASDWNTFNNKVSTVNGQTGAITLLGGNAISVTNVGSAITIASTINNPFQYEGTWNPNTNTPTLVDGTGTTGFVYWVSAARTTAVAGLANPSMYNFQIGDLVLYNGTQWELTTPAAGVQSVNGAQGAVTVNAINQLTGDGTAGPVSGSTSAAFTLATVNANVGTFSYPTLTVNAKGLITAISSNTVTSGTVTSVSVVSANGLAGTVANPTTTPAITLSTTITGILQGNGTAISAASTTGTGSVVLATSPTLVTPNLGTPSALTLTNATGLPLSTGVTGTLAATNFPALTGDVTTTAGSLATTLATVNSTPGTYTYATLTVNAKGLVTSASSGTTPTNGTVTSVSVVSANGLAGTVATATTTPAITLSTTITGILQGNGTAISAATTTGTGSVVLATSPTLVTPALGTPSSATLTNATGLPLSTGVTGTLQATNFPALTGDVTTTAGSLATTLATVNANVGSFTNASITVNAKGLITAASSGSAGLTNPMTTAGDMIYGGTGGTPTRLAAGTSGQVPVSTGSTVAFGTITSSGVTTSTFTAPTVQRFTSGSGTYNTPTSPRTPLYIKVRMVGGGGGGATSGTAGSTAATGGGTTTFGTSLLSCTGGGAATFNGGTGGTGGTASITSPAIGTGWSGGNGAGNIVNNANPKNFASPGGMGASSYLGGAGSSQTGNAGGPGVANTGSGGAGGGSGAIASVADGPGGGAGAYIEAVIPSPSGPYSYTVGSGGSGGVAGTSGFAGGAGAAGIIEVFEFYQ